MLAKNKVKRIILIAYWFYMIVYRAMCKNRNCFFHLNYAVSTSGKSPLEFTIYLHAIWKNLIESASVSVQIYRAHVVYKLYLARSSVRLVWLIALAIY